MRASHHAVYMCHGREGCKRESLSRAHRPAISVTDMRWLTETRKEPSSAHLLEDEVKARLGGRDHVIICLRTGRLRNLRTVALEAEIPLPLVFYSFFVSISAQWRLVCECSTFTSRESRLCTLHLLRMHSYCLVCLALLSFSLLLAFTYSIALVRCSLNLDLRDCHSSPPLRLFYLASLLGLAVFTIH